ncbi:unnamed protein product [Arabis nemorensis]|uniref:Zinc knuckle CX2CX4HX4C domain-containing protein n=1 Tax=Arabis nemorensis TaxID=586526 RepID=A0A565BSK6_9BRAS|nr:unnamed protein product [Arabis nemorensis]
MDGHELTKMIAKIRVTIDGLKPLIQETILEFSTGEETIVALEYERLASHCTHCLMLTHEKKDCPQIITQPEVNETLRQPPNQREYNSNQERNTNVNNNFEYGQIRGSDTQTPTENQRSREAPRGLRFVMREREEQITMEDTSERISILKGVPSLIGNRDLTTLDVPMR